MPTILSTPSNYLKYQAATVAAVLFLLAIVPPFQAFGANVDLGIGSESRTTALRTTTGKSIKARTTPALTVNKDIPVLNWVERSDWINVRTDISPMAFGDGKHDDTAAIQVALNKIGPHPGDPKVVYLPEGQYRITGTLKLTRRNGGMLIGHGRNTHIIWDGKIGGRMFWSNGAARQTYRGIVWDGAGKAGIGIDHDSKNLYETRVLHEDMEFRNFLEAGIRVGHDQKLASAEMLFSNLKFSNNKHGALFLAWNDYNNIFDGCYFVGNEYGIRAEKGNVVIRNSRFERSGQSDIFLSTHSHSVRRVISSGSHSFIRTVRGPISNGLIKVEDCLVDHWTNPDGAIITGLRGPVTVFDTTFSNPPGKSPPIKLDNPRYMNQIAILSNVVSNDTTSVIDSGPNGIIHKVAPDRHQPPLITIDQNFLHDKLVLTTNILDVKVDCGAKGDGRGNDTKAIQNCFDKALKQTQSTTVYFPSGTYRITKTINTHEGAHYQIDGTGWHSQIVLSGKAGTALHIHNPQGLRVEHIAIGGPKGTTTILQTGTIAGRVYYHNVFGYHADETKNVRIIFDGLPPGTIVNTGHLDGRLTIRNSSEATLLIGFLTSVQMIVEGDGPQSGFLGILSRVSALEMFPLIIRDNRSITMTDWYNEQTQHLVLAEGNGKGTGLIALDHTQAATTDKILSEVNGYQGMLAHFGGMFGRAASDEGRSISVKHSKNFNILLAGNMYWHKSPHIDGTLSKAVLLGNSLNKRFMGPFSTVKNSKNKNYDTDISRVFDAFRKLGYYDLVLNYEQTDTIAN